MNSRRKAFELCEHELLQEHLKCAAHEHQAAVVALAATKCTAAWAAPLYCMHAYCECFGRLVVCEGMHIVEILVEASHPDCINGFTHARHAHVQHLLPSF